MNIQHLALIAAMIAAPTLALAGNSTVSGTTGVAGSIGTLAGTPIGSCMPTTVNGVTVPGCAGN
ncbi:MAG: hypothetical protein KJZ59_09045 [Pararhodobacter sp.]|nr:hypothetical protein [Pararhodobacter sp.]